MTAEPAHADEESGRAALGRALRYLRERSGRSLGQLAGETRYDKSYLYRLEAGQRLSKLAVMEDLDRYYESGDLLVRLWKVARREVFKDRYKEFMRLEPTACIMHKFTLGIPGLLQTEEVARNLLSSAQETAAEAELIEEQVVARMGRQQLLRRTPAPSVRVIIDEYALRRPVPDTKVWQEQLTHLLDTANLPSIVLQVLPFSEGAHHLMDGSLTLLWQEDGTSIAYTEGNGCAELIEDPAGVTRYRLSYDRLRDLALPPPESIGFIRGVLEEHRS
ncbi:MULTISPECIES: helix-turn-helix domain-containing protein [Streptomyces]|uniref:helix-turn-helix domain-containing protein n=1 Tax=Streptomyces TaxID=1883 RepID=UPI00081B0C74|nr:MULTISPECIES: helix-turn-helix transcriptional regulator [unclassified Streptomyces]MYQ50057.1 helix-turn-helix domain-containing protein [Streptomyces sp. SID4941]SCD32636.1 Helix-turn-helix domain-containing protein [Streptomyces sp. PalvLS-984]SDE13649.1 Helix-turn-helix domain-containing protein [Streptomyces sp. AmelKG-A3]